MRLMAKGLGADELRDRIQVRHSRARAKLSHQCQQRREQPEQITTAAQHSELSYRRLHPDGSAIWLNMIPDYAPSSAKPWDCKTSGNQCVGAFRRLFALSVASIPARVSTGSHLPRTCTTCSKRGFTGAWQGTRG